MKRVFRLLASGVTGAAGALAFGQTADLERLGRDLAQEKSSLEKLSQRDASILEELDAREAQLAPIEEAARRFRAEAAAAEKTLSEVASREAGAKRDLDRALDALAPRLAARYRLARSGAASFYAASSSAAALLRRKRLVDLVLAEDLARLSQAKLLSENLARLREERDRDASEAASRAAAARAKADEARERRQGLRRLHDKILAERNLHERAVAELEKAHARLASLIEKARAQAFPGRGEFARLKGKLAYPAPGFVEVGFGRVVNPRFNTVTFQKGIDLRAPLGTPVAAVAPGRVVHAGWFRGYGNLVIVDHGDGFHTLAAHLETVAKGLGEDVARGEPVGTVGETGSLKGPYLYFEIRQRGKPVDPTDWLGPP